MGLLLSPCSSKIQGRTRTSRYHSPGVAICYGRHHRARSGVVRKDSWAMGTPVGVLVLQRGNEDTPAAPWNSSVPSVHGIRRRHMNFLPRIPQDMLNIKLIHSPKFFSTSLPYLCPSASAPPSTSPSVRSPTSRSPSPDLRPRYQEDQRERSLHDPAELSSVSR